jgi:hypothetical protein
VVEEERNGRKLEVVKRVAVDVKVKGTNDEWQKSGRVL